MWPTGSKDISKKVLLSPEGVGGVLEVLTGTGVEAVAIGKLYVHNTGYVKTELVADDSYRRYTSS